MKRVPIALAAVLAFAPAHAASYFAFLDGSQEVPPAATPATGYGTIAIAGDIMTVDIAYANLLAPLTIAHIHCCAPRGANAGIAIDLDMIPLPTRLSGSFSRVFARTLASSFRPAFIAASGGTVELARARLLNAFDSETAYFNLHTSRFPGGEIRGQIAVLPEPGTWALLVAGFGLVGAMVRRRAFLAA